MAPSTCLVIASKRTWTEPFSCHSVVETNGFQGLEIWASKPNPRPCPHDNVVTVQ
jgi:hypothetical protein